MPQTPVQAQQEQPYGAKVAQERNENMQEAATMVAAAQYPQIFAEGEDSQIGNVATQTGNVPPAGVTIKNPYMLLPPAMNFPQLRQKTPAEQNYDAGLLFQILGQSSPALRAVSEELLRKRNGNIR